jgi:CRP-like cAMP-binding protein
MTVPAPAEQHEAISSRHFVAHAFGCSPEIAAQIVKRGRVRQFDQRAIILREGDLLKLAYLLLAGRAQALLYGAEGQVIVLCDFWPGDLFGAIGEPESARQNADIVAVDQVETFTLEAAELARLAEQYGAIGLALSRMLMARLRQMTGRMYERAVLSAVGRVYAELLREARRTPDLRLSPAPILSELALRVSTTRETASRAVNALERRGIIRRDAASLTVVAPHRLEALIV